MTDATAASQPQHHPSDASTHERDELEQKNEGSSNDDETSGEDVPPSNIALIQHLLSGLGEKAGQSVRSRGTLQLLHEYCLGIARFWLRVTLAHAEKHDTSGVGLPDATSTVIEYQFPTSWGRVGTILKDRIAAGKLLGNAMEVSADSIRTVLREAEFTSPGPSGGPTTVVVPSTKLITEIAIITGFLLNEVLELAWQARGYVDAPNITPRHIFLAIMYDSEIQAVSASIDAPFCRAPASAATAAATAVFKSKTKVAPRSWPSRSCWEHMVAATHEHTLEPLRQLNHGCWYYDPARVAEYARLHAAGQPIPGAQRTIFDDHHITPLCFYGVAGGAAPHDQTVQPHHLPLISFSFETNLPLLLSAGVPAALHDLREFSALRILCEVRDLRDRTADDVTHMLNNNYTTRRVVTATMYALLPEDEDGESETDNSPENKNLIPPYQDHAIGDAFLVVAPDGSVAPPFVERRDEMVHDLVIVGESSQTSIMRDLFSRLSKHLAPAPGSAPQSTPEKQPGLSTATAAASESSSSSPAEDATTLANVPPSGIVLFERALTVALGLADFDRYGPSLYHHHHPLQAQARFTAEVLLLHTSLSADVCQLIGEYAPTRLPYIADADATLVDGRRAAAAWAEHLTPESPSSNSNSKLSGGDAAMAP